ncbi:MAG TPA: DUF5615 family PIN-like protein [Gemmatimonadales bacterium]
MDAQLPSLLATWRVQRRDAHVDGLGLLRAKDAAIFAAAREEGRQHPPLVVVTKDEDFIKLLERHGTPPQVVWVTCGNVSNAELHRIMSTSWPRAAALLRAGEPLVELR